MAAELSAPEAARDPVKRKALGREHARLEPIVRSGRRFLKLTAELAAARDLLASGDADLAEMARQEIAALEPEAAALESQLTEALTPHDPLDDRDAIVEVRAGTGGDEAALFAAELLRLYTRFAEGRGWKAELVDLNTTGLKGVKQAVLYIQGRDVYSWLRHEGGVHRVQRVPTTEASGRRHTSTVTVAVLPAAEEGRSRSRPTTWSGTRSGPPAPAARTSTK